MITIEIKHEHKGLIVKWANQIRHKAPDLDPDSVVYEILAELWRLEKRFDPTRDKKFTTLAEIHLRRTTPTIIGRLRGTKAPYYTNRKGGAPVQSMEYRVKKYPISESLEDTAPGPLQQLIEKEDREVMEAAFQQALDMGGEEFTEIIRGGASVTRVPKDGAGVAKFIRMTGRPRSRRSWMAERYRRIQRNTQDFEDACAQILAQLKAEQEAA